MLPCLRLGISNMSIKGVSLNSLSDCNLCILHFFVGAVRLTFCGGIAGVSLWIAIFPADVIKSRIQVLLPKCALFLDTLLSSLPPFLLIGIKVTLLSQQLLLIFFFDKLS